MLIHGIRALFVAESSITALAPSQTVERVLMPSICTDNAPQKMEPPYVVIKEIDTDPMITLDSTYNASMKSTDIEVDAVAYTAGAARTLALAIRQFFQDYAGTVTADAISDTIKAVLWTGQTYSYDFPSESLDTRFHIVTTKFTVQWA